MNTANSILLLVNILLQIFVIHCDSSLVNSSESENIHKFKKKSVKQLGPIFVDDAEFEDKVSASSELFDQKLPLPLIENESLNQFFKNEDHDDNLRPPSRLITIVEKHISEMSAKNSTNEFREKLIMTRELKSSYDVPFSSVTGNLSIESKINLPMKRSPPATSYGIPDVKSTPYPPYNSGKPKRSFEKSNITGPPATSFGVPDAKISSEIFKRNTNISDLNVNNETLSSYSVAMNWVLGLSNDTFDILSFGVPDVEIKQKFNEQESDKEIIPLKTSDGEKNQFLRFGRSNFDKTSVSIQKSISSSYDLSKDGVLSKKVYVI